MSEVRFRPSHPLKDLTSVVVASLSRMNNGLPPDKIWSGVFEDVDDVVLQWVHILVGVDHGVPSYTTSLAFDDCAREPVYDDYTADLSGKYRRGKA